MSTEKTILGIDYGSKMAGTTVVAQMVEGQVNFWASEKKRDADAMIQSLVEELKPNLIAIDAPLSLPGVYTGLPGCADYFYRECDRLSGAMSPMFLGGLTARAMKLAARPRADGSEVIEVYPVKTGNDMGLKEFGYRQKEQDQIKLLESLYLKTGIDLRKHDQLSGHHIDAAIALFIGQQYASDVANKFGNLNEGFIYY